jgi:glyoxylase-like metal-dependent hydrolase (beta-lactamase superfamily II)/rhodanese-related sulfurtransferase
VIARASAPVAFVDDGLGNSSYLVDLGDQRALVVDPTRHPAGYLAEAERRGLDIAFAVETHLHADFVSGARELGALGASLLVPGAGGHEFPVRGLVDGEEVDLAGLTLRAVATPGHTPEHLAYLMLDGPSPIALFSGGSLLVGAVARTDLIAPEQTEPLARSLWRSLHDRILTLPDDLPVFPTHGAGSFCSAPAGGERVTTIGREKASNPLLAAGDEDAFVKLLLDGAGTYPPYFLRLRDVNRRGPHMYGPGPAHLALLDVASVDALVREDAWIIDTRRIERFAVGHVAGSVSIALRDAFATWLGWLVPDDVPLVFVVDDDQDDDLLVREARKVGYERIAGALAGGIDAWRLAGRGVARTELVDVAHAVPPFIDVRQNSEFAGGHVPGARLVELGDVASTAVPAGATMMCGHGERAMSAASVVERHHATHLRVLVGGPDAWAEAHRTPLDRA